MGQDFRAILAHGMQPEAVLSLPERLNAEMPLLRPLLRAARLEGRHLDARVWPYGEWEWDWDPSNDPPFHEWIRSEWAGVHGPGSLFLQLGERAVELGCWVRWKEFLSDLPVQEAMRTLTRHFARLLGSPSAVYLPDSGWEPAERASGLVTFGKSFDEILQQLNEEAGPPAPSLEAICRREGGEIEVVTLWSRKRVRGLDCNGCYVDHF